MRATPKRAYVTSPLDLGFRGPRRVCAALVLVIGKIQAFLVLHARDFAVPQGDLSGVVYFVFRVFVSFLARVSLIRTAARISRCVKVKVKT